MSNNGAKPALEPQDTISPELLAEWNKATQRFREGAVAVRSFQGPVIPPVVPLSIELSPEKNKAPLESADSPRLSQELLFAWDQQTERMKVISNRVNGIAKAPGSEVVVSADPGPAPFANKIKV
jgi:hypothetical protein